MKIDFSQFEHGVHWYKYMTIEDGGRKICVQLEPDDDGELPEAEKETLELFLEKYAQYKQLLLKPIFDYYQKSRDAWGAVEPDDEKFPEVKDMYQLSEMISLHGIMVRDEAWFGKRTVDLFYDCAWDEEEGLGIEIVLGDTVSECKVREIGNIGDVY